MKVDFFLENCVACVLTGFANSHDQQQKILSKLAGGKMPSKILFTVIVSSASMILKIKVDFFLV